jgi:two-component system sensor kinase FixL
MSPGMHHDLFHISPISILCEDWSSVRAEVMRKIDEGITDFDAFLDANPAFIAGVRKLHSVVDANPAALSLIGVTSLEALRADVSRYLPADPQASFMRAMARGERQCQGERKIVRDDGTFIPIIWRVTLPKAPEDFDRVYFHAVDVTEQKRAEEELHVARSNLNHAGRLSLVGELSTSLAHEISQPLSSIVTYSHLAEKVLRTGNEGEVKAAAMVERIGRNARHATGVVNRIKDFARRRTAEFAPIDTVSLLEDALALVEHEAGRLGATVVLELPKTLPPVHGDRIQIQQVVVNVIINALQAMTNQESTLRRVVVSAARADSSIVEISIDDTGPGIPKSEMERIFEPFFSTKPEGVGLGLSICRRIVDEHGGRLWVVDNPGGASVRFTLPIAGSCEVHPDDLRSTLLEVS